MNIQTAITSTMKNLTKTAVNATQEVAKVGAAGAAVAVEMMKRARGMNTANGMQIDASAIAAQVEETTEVQMSFEETMLDAASTAEMQEAMSADLMEDMPAEPVFETATDDIVEG